MTTFILAVGGLLATSLAFAAPPGHGHGHGNQKDPRFVDRGDTLRASGEVRGLDNHRNARVEIEAEARVRVECRRMGGGHGHGHGSSFDKTIYIDVDGSEFYSRHAIHGNRLEYSVETEDLYDIENYYGNVCPGHYEARVKSVRFSSAKVEVRQNHQRVMTWLCSFDRDTQNGPVPRSDVDCHTLF